MKNNILEKLKTIPRFCWIFLAIMVVGIFLRTYNFHDWLRFNADQGRDAELVSSVVEGQASWPLLGPKAGGTNFKLGPAFYDLEIVAAKIFGNYPDKMAYPDLFTGILCIPLLFLFLRKYFDQKISLGMTAIFAVSSYAIRYARFAWNPNSTSFWSILALYAIHEVISHKQSRKFSWSVVAGVAIGIGVQLHTTLMLFLPITTIIVFAYLFVKKENKLKYFLVILTVALLLNIPQFLDLQQTNGANFKEFFRGMKTKQSGESSLLTNVWQGNNTLVQITPNILGGYEMADKFDINLAHGHIFDALVFVLSLIFVVGGVVLAVRYFRRETDADKKVFLALLFVYTSSAYLIFIKLAFELSVRFYLVLIFLPFFFLGFWLQFLREKLAARYNLILLITCIALVSSNLFFVQESFTALANYSQKGGGDMDVTILQEAEVFSQFIIDNSSDAKSAYMDGDAKFLFKAYKSIAYLVAKSQIKLVQVNKKSGLPNQYFYLGTIKDRNGFLNDSNIKVLQYRTCGSFAIILVQDVTMP